MCQSWSESYHPCEFPHYGTNCTSTFSHIHFRSFVISTVVYCIVYVILLVHYFIQIRQVIWAMKTQRRKMPNSRETCDIFAFICSLFLLIAGIDPNYWDDYIPWRGFYQFQYILSIAVIAMEVTILISMVQTGVVAIISPSLALSGNLRHIFSLVLNVFVWISIFIPGSFEAEGVGVVNGTIEAIRQIISATWMGICILFSVFVCISLTRRLMKSQFETVRSSIFKVNSGGYESLAEGSRSPEQKIKKILYFCIICVLIGSISIAYNIVNAISNYGKKRYESPPCTELDVWSHFPAIVQIICLIMYEIACKISGSRIQKSKISIQSAVFEGYTRLDTNPINDNSMLEI